MRYLLITTFLCSVLMTGCAGPQLMKCPTAADPDTYQCKETIKGDFKMCRQPGDLFRCVEAQ